MARDRFAQGLFFGAGVAALVVAGWLFVKLLALFVMVLLALIIASGLSPVVRAVERVKFGKKHLPRAVAIALPLLVVVLLVIGFGSMVVQVVGREAQDFSARWPEYEARARDWVDAMSARYTWLPDQSQVFEKLRGSLGQLAQLSTSGIGAVFGVLGGVASSLLVVFIAFNLLLSREAITGALLAMVPDHRRAATRTIWRKMSLQLGGWVRAQLILAIVMGGSAWIWLTVLGVKYAFLLAVLVGLGEFVPMLGPTIAAGTAALVAVLTGSLNQALLVIVLSVVMQGLENYYLVPRIMRSEVGLHPLVTVLSFLGGGMLLGLVGAVLAVPVAAALSVPFHEVLQPALARWSGNNERAAPS